MKKTIEQKFCEAAKGKVPGCDNYTLKDIELFVRDEIGGFPKSDDWNPRSEDVAWCRLSNDWGYWTKGELRLDSHCGLCSKGDYQQIRYLRRKTDADGKTVSVPAKMKAGKFFRRIVAERSDLAWIPEEVVTYVSEVFAAQWRSHAMGMLNQGERLKLVVDDDFYSIYSSDFCSGNFGSCMTDYGYETFYRDSVEARAASLCDENGVIYARCIIFDDVKTPEGRVRYAERQYADLNFIEGDDYLKRLLVRKLIEAGEIDCYKAIGARAKDSDNILGLDGKPYKHRCNMSIRCCLEPDDRLSYQDTFFNYNPYEHYATNDEDDASAFVDLRETGGAAQSNFDDYLNRRTFDEVVYYNALNFSTHEYYEGQVSRLYFEDHEDEFTEFDGDWYANRDMARCPYCDELFPEGAGKYSSITEKEYCCEFCLDHDEAECMEDLEEERKEEVEA